MEYFFLTLKLCFLYNDTKKSKEFDANSFPMGEKIGGINLRKAPGLISMLKIDKKGTVQRKTFRIKSEEFIVGYSCSDNYNLYSPSRKVDGLTYSKSRLVKFDFSKF